MCESSRRRKWGGVRMSRESQEQKKHGGEQRVNSGGGEVCGSLWQNSKMLRSTLSPSCFISPVPPTVVSPRRLCLRFQDSCEHRRQKNLVIDGGRGQGTEESVLRGG